MVDQFEPADEGAEPRVLAIVKTLVARLDRPHVPDVEYPSERSYLLVRR